MLPAFFLQKIARTKENLHVGPIDPAIIGAWVDQLFRSLFLLRYERENEASSIISAMAGCEHQLMKVIGVSQSKEFFLVLPGVYDALMLDVVAIQKADPAAGSPAEVMIAYPGFYAIALYRFAHQLFTQGLSLEARIVTEYAHGKTGIDIHPAAIIGKSFSIDHGTGIVIGATTLIGHHVKLYQGVTLGAFSVEKSSAQCKRHPTVESDVTIYAGATILGGNTVIGAGSIIGCNTWITSSVAPDSIVYTVAKQELKPIQTFSESIHFFI
ncbi:MAG: serine acetyltransferase [Bacteroidota bacterium]